MAHDARTGRLLVSTRPRGAAFFGLSELDPSTGSLRTLAAPDGDVAWPAYTSRGYLYQVERSGQSMLQLGPGGRGSAALAEGRTRLLGLSPDGATAVVWHASLGTAAELLELSLDSGQTRPLLAGAPSGSALAVKPEVVVIAHPQAGVELRDFLWRLPRPAEHRKLVVEVAPQGEPPDSDLPPAARPAGPGGL